MAKVTKELVASTLAAGRRVFIEDEFGEFTQVKSASKVTDQMIEDHKVRIEKEPVEKFVAGQILNDTFVPFDHKGLVTGTLNASPRFGKPTAAKVKATEYAGKEGKPAIAKVVAPLVYDKTLRTINYGAEIVKDSVVAL